MAVFLLSACAPPSVQDEAGTRSRQDRIIGGVDAPNDIAVVELAFSGEGFCTGTLIAPRTVLTAAHCINAAGPGSYAARFYLPASAGYTTTSLDILEQHAHPRYDETTLVNDVGVLKLSAVAPHAPAKLTPLFLGPALVGEDIRHVGYGQGSVARDQVTFPIREVGPVTIESGTVGKSACYGDSGGPGFITLAGYPGEFLAGVISHGDWQCSGKGFDQRVDVVLPWIWSVASAWETATCDFDGQCKAGCASDPDCNCKADGVCNSTCTGVTLDSDCGDCGANGVCSKAQCPQPEPDCVNDGEACIAPSMCVGGACTTDSQHTSYCTTACNASGSCKAGMQCVSGLCKFVLRPEKQLGQSCTPEDLCVGLGSICAPDAHCRQTCGDGGTCFRSGEECVTTATPAYCAPKTTSYRPPPALNYGPTDGGPGIVYDDPPPEPSGCAAVPGSSGLFFSALLLASAMRCRRTTPLP